MVRQKTTKIILILLVCSTWLHAQVKETDSRLGNEDLKMTFPGIYFKHNSTDYAAMPYTVDSCFKYMAFYVKDIYSFVIWRDSAETEELTNKRIDKLKAELNKYTPSKKIDIISMGEQQKISRHTINLEVNSERIQYLLSLNSVFDISKTRFPTGSKWKNHIERPRLFCWECWKSGFHIKLRRQLKTAKSKKQ
jgi:hypothetical protein